MILPVTFITRKKLDLFLEALQENERLNQECEQLKHDTTHASSFIQSIKEGKLDTTFNGFESSDKVEAGSLAGALLSMREQMQKIAQEERERNWTTEGLAQFVDILRSNNENVEKLYDSILDNLVNYIQANQGALFLTMHDNGGENQEDVYLEMVACYAYSKKKYLNTRVDVGEGLVGQCYLEKDSIFLTEVPAKYTHITSGLGAATPRCVLIVPLKLNEKIFGVIELASFHVLPNYQIEFVKKLSESIASTIANAQTNERTRQLLHISQQQAEDMRTSEEEMRQNMEELRATQEEMRRKDAEMTGVMTAVNTSLVTVEFAMDGAILNANETFLKLMGYEIDEVRGKHHRIFMNKKEAASPEYIQFWADLNAGMPQSKDFMRISKEGREVWLRATYSPVRDITGRYYKIIKLANDITERKLAEIENQRLSLVANNTDNSVVITNPQGQIEYVNSGFQKLTGYTLSEVIGKKPGTFLQGVLTDKITIARIRESLNKQIPLYEEILNYGKDGNTYWISLSINPIFDDNDVLVNFVAVQADITDTKRQSLDYKGKLEAIDKTYGVVELDTEGRILFMNTMMLNLLGYEDTEVIGRHHRMLVSETEVKSDGYNVFWDKLGKRGEYVVGEFKRICKNGKEIWLKGTYNAVIGLDGKPSKVVQYAQDITTAKLLEMSNQQQTEELRAQEEELRQNMEEMQAVQEDLKKRYLESAKIGAELDARVGALNAAAILSESDAYGNITYVNDKLLQVTGYTREELIGQPHSKLRHSDTAKEIFAEMWTTIKAGRIFQGTYKNRKKDGSAYWVDATIAPVMGADGKPEKYIGIRFDITTAKEAEQAIQQQLEELSAQEEEIRQNMEEMQAVQEDLAKRHNESLLVSAELDARVAALNASAILSESDAYGNITYVNEKLLQITGYTREELIGKPHSKLRHPDTAKEIFAEMWATIKAGKIFKGTYQNRKKDGSAYWVEATIAPVLDADGKPEKYIGIRFDITASKVAEQAIQQQMEELSAQEEEIRQNMEEMQATTETVERQALEMKGIMNALDSSLATIEFDTQGNVMAANDNFLKVMGYRLDEIVGKPHRLFIDPEYARSKQYLKFWDDLNFGKPQVGEVKRITKHGEEVWLSASYTPVFDIRGKVSKIIKFAQDVTPQKAIALDTSCKLDAIDKAYGVVEFDTQGNILKANDNFLDIVGYNMSDIKDRHHRIFMPESERNSEDYRLFWEKLGKKGEFVSGDFRRIAKNGKTIWLKGTYSPILDLSGKPYKVVKYAQNITAAKLMEQANQQQIEEISAQEEELRQNMEEMQAIQESVEIKQREVQQIAQKYEQILEGCADAVVMIDNIGHIEFFNAAAENLWGYLRTEVMGQNVKMLMGGTHNANHDNYLANYNKTREAKVIGKGRKVDALCKDGSAVPILLTISEAILADGTSIFTAFVKDLREVQ